MDDISVDSKLRSAQPPRRLSAIIEQVAGNASGPVSVEHVRDALGDRSFAAMLAFFSIINLLPLPPGTTIVLGPPLILVAVQMALGHNRVWLPKFILRKSLSQPRFDSLSKRYLPRLEKLERLIRPRHWPFARSGLADRVIGIFALVLAIAVTIPIPLGNWLPALAILLIALALSERDGILFYAGVFVGSLALAIIAAVIGAAGALAGMLFA